MKTIISIIALFTYLQSEYLLAQDIPFPENLTEEYLFGQNQKSDPQIITKNGVYLFKNKWSYSDFEKTYSNTLILENLKEFNSQNFNVINDSLSTLIVVSGGGHVFSATKKSLIRLDSSVDQKNQFNSFHTFIILANKRDKLKRYLEKKKISTAIHYPKLIFNQKAYTNKFKKINSKHYPKSKYYVKNILTLPINEFVTKYEIKKISNEIVNFYNFH